MYTDGNFISESQPCRSDETEGLPMNGASAYLYETGIWTTNSKQLKTSMRKIKLKLLKDDIGEHLYDIEERFCAQNI